MADDEQIDFACPRCKRHATARFYGPCESCCAQLRANLVGEARTIVVGGFEPKMHVVPNQVASKE